MKAYKGTFRKRNEELREMEFVRIPDIIAETPDFVAVRIKGTGGDRKVGDGMELVWDLVTDNFRYFNHETQVGELKEFEVSSSLFVE